MVDLPCKWLGQRAGRRRSAKRPETLEFDQLWVTHISTIFRLKFLKAKSFGSRYFRRLRGMIDPVLGSIGRSCPIFSAGSRSLVDLNNASLSSLLAEKLHDLL